MATYEPRDKYYRKAREKGLPSRAAFKIEELITRIKLPPEARAIVAHAFGMMFGTLEKRPAFEKYWQRVSSRPAYKRANELDEALTKKAS